MNEDLFIIRPEAPYGSVRGECSVAVCYNAGAQNPKLRVVGECGDGRLIHYERHHDKKRRDRRHTYDDHSGMGQFKRAGMDLFENDRIEKSCTSWWRY
jgi:hypothetical protein